MTQRLRFARRPAVRRLISPRSLLLTAFVVSALFSTTVLVSAADGDLDATFGSGGIVITNHSEFEQIHDIVIQPDGKIVAAGTSGTLPFLPFFESPALDILVARYNSDGSLDSTFGSNGFVTTSLGANDNALSVALQADGKIVVAGSGTPNNQSVFAVVRYNPNGSLDSSFGSGGIVTTDAGPFGSAKDLAIQSDGKIVVTGTSTLGITVVRYNTDGSLDNTFDDDGIIREFPAGFLQTHLAWAIALQADGKIVIAGESIDNSQNIGTDDFLLLRYNPDGSLDSTFDDDGLVSTEFAMRSNSARDVVIQPDGKIVAAGFSFLDAGSVVSLARYNTDGSLDTSFDGDGIVVSATNSANRYVANALVLQSDGKILVAGDSVDSGNLVLTVSRYNADGSADTTFGGDGIVTTANGTHLTATAIALQTDGKIVAGGYANFTIDPNTVHVVSDLALVRYDNTVATNAGLVNGGGWISSPEGTASFGFVAKGASVPTGAITFQFRAGDLNFKSTSYDSLVISGNKAQVRGAGKINGNGDYRFILTCIDGDQPGGGGVDKFRMRIWSDNDGLIYDNQLNAPDNDDPTTVLGGGNIVIHR